MYAEYTQQQLTFLALLPWGLSTETTDSLLWDTETSYGLIPDTNETPETTDSMMKLQTDTGNYEYALQTTVGQIKLSRRTHKTTDAWNYSVLQR